MKGRIKVRIYRSEQRARNRELSQTMVTIERLESRLEAEKSALEPDAAMIVDLLGQLMALESERSRIVQAIIGSAPYVAGGFLRRVQLAQRREAEARSRIALDRIQWIARASSAVEVPELQPV